MTPSGIRNPSPVYSDYIVKIDPLRTFQEHFFDRKVGSLLVREDVLQWNARRRVAAGTCHTYSILSPLCPTAASFEASVEHDLPVESYSA